MTIPNFLTLIRFFLVPMIIYAMIIDAMGWALFGFALAGISDAVDGFIARQFNQRSELGTYLDPIADKVLLVSVFVMLGYLGDLPYWLVILAVSRDLLIVGGVLLASLMGNPVEMKPLFVSKANTTAQILLAIFVMAEAAFATSLGVLRPIMVFLSAILTVASAAAYVVTWLRHMGQETDDQTI